MHSQSEIGTIPKQWQRPRSLVELTSKLGQRSIVLALLATIVVLDQAVKWWAFRHLPTFINHGGDVLVGSTVSTWFSDPLQGMLLDLLNCGLLSIAISVLWRRRRSLLVLISGCMMIGGWGSNLLDRLFMHYLTAPGAGRGAVDFILIGPHYYNLADLFIIVGTPLFVLAVGTRYLRKWVAKRPAASVPLPSTGRGRRPAPTPVSRFGGVVSLAALVGATDDRR
ncbi:MAG: signal peptidase [Frankiales bacterium]|nr:signal peptidase [Frankiales bacterium]